MSNIDDNSYVPDWLRDEPPPLVGFGGRQDIRAAKGEILEGVNAAACRLTELAVVLSLPLNEVISIVAGNYETSVLDLQAGHSEAMGWMHVGKKERKAIMAVHKNSPPPPPSGECYVCGAWHSN